MNLQLKLSNPPHCRQCSDNNTEKFILKRFIETRSMVRKWREIIGIFFHDLFISKKALFLCGFWRRYFLNLLPLTTNLLKARKRTKKSWRKNIKPRNWKSAKKIYWNRVYHLEDKPSKIIFQTFSKEMTRIKPYL